MEYFERSAFFYFTMCIQRCTFKKSPTIVCKQQQAGVDMRNGTILVRPLSLIWLSQETNRALMFHFPLQIVFKTFRSFDECFNGLGADKQVAVGRICSFCRMYPNFAESFVEKFI